MKVVHLCTHDFGGAAMAAIQLHEEMLRENVDSVFLTLVKSRNDIPKHIVTNGFDTLEFPLLGRLIYKLNSILIKIGIKDDKRNIPANNHLKERPKGSEIFSLPYSYFNILDHPEIKSADVIHLHWVSYSMIDYVKFFHGCKKNVVWTLHDMYPFTGGCHHADNCLGYLNDCSFCPQLKTDQVAKKWHSYKRNAVGGFNLKKFKLISPSIWMANQVKQSSLFSSVLNTIIPNGFNISFFHEKDRYEMRRKLNLPKDKILFLFNAYDINNQRKGILELVSAFSKLDRNEVALVCIGNKFDFSSNEIDMIYSGYIEDRNILAEYYNAADFFILPSKAENLPNTIIESLLCGTPVVAFNTGGIPELLNDENGILVDHFNVDSLQNAIESAIKKKSNFKKEVISSSAKAKYSIKIVFSRHMELYNSFHL